LRSVNFPFGGVISVKAATAADLFGTYTFTATITFASDELKAKYESVLKSECEVSIGSSTYYDFDITGLAGGDGTQGAVFSGTTITINNPSTNNYYLWSSASLGVGDKDGVYNQPLEYTYDESTGDITLPDFTAVVVTDWMTSPATSTTVATFTSCKLTLKGKTTVMVDDLTGDWHFTAGTGAYSTKEGSTFPTEFDLSLSTNDATCKSYSGQLTFDGYDPISLNDITFDGSSFSIAIDNTYINADQTMRLGDGNGSATSNITFNYTGSVLSLTSGMAIVKKGDDGSAAYEQWYMDGTMRKSESPVAVDWAGIYTVTVGYAYLMKTDVDYPDTGEKFTIEITKSSYNDKYYVTSFMGNDTYSLNYGGIPCEESGDTLKIATGNNRYVRSVYMADDYSEMSYDVLYDGLGSTATTVNIIKNADDTYSISDFFLKRSTVKYDTSSWSVSGESVDNAAYYSQLAIDRQTDAIKLASTSQESQVRVVDGCIILGGTQSVTVYDAGGQKVYQGVTSKVGGLAKGLYIVKGEGKAVKVLLR